LAHRLSVTLIHRPLAKNHLAADDLAIAWVLFGARALWNFHHPFITGGDREARRRRHFTSDGVAADALVKALAVFAALLDLVRAIRANGVCLAVADLVFLASDRGVAHGLVKALAIFAALLDLVGAFGADGVSEAGRGGFRAKDRRAARGHFQTRVTLVLEASLGFHVAIRASGHCGALILR
jgi:hypothetical protein